VVIQAMSINIFYKGDLKHIVLRDKIEALELDGVDFALREATNCKLSFVNLKSIPKALIESIVETISIDQLQLEVEHPRLAKYLNGLGLHTQLLAADTKVELYKPKPLKAITIGGSADSLDKIVSIVEHIPLANIALFIVQHIKEDTKPLFDKILQNKTRYRVCYPKNGESIQEGSLYIAPPAVHMRIKEGKIYLDRLAKVNYARPSISVLFESVAHTYGNENITVLTCGYGNDGSDALSVLRKKGSCVIVSDPHECQAKDMVTNAIATHAYSHVFTLDGIRSFLNTLLQTVVDRESFIQRFLKEIKEVYGYDFTRYNRQSITRRVEAMMQSAGIDSLPLLAKEVLSDKRVFDELVLSISINVTQFFRKPPLYEALYKLLMQECRSMHPKIWVAGCATGEEAYSVAMILDELQRYKDALIYATDFNAIVVDEANNGLYSKEAIEGAIERSQAILKNSSILHYLDKHSSYYAIKEYLKQNVLFFTHNLVSDRSFNQFNIISCKNVLIYFSLTLQEVVINLFYDSLCEGGFLLLGESESLPLGFTHKFKTYSIEAKIYQKVS
jgi:chemotaxis protein methyltransferase CheR